MNHVKEAALLTRETLMLLPLIVFCFLPVMQKIKDSTGVLVVKILFVIAGMEAIIFCVYFLCPQEYAIVLNSFLCVVIFFWLYQRQVALERSHLWFVFMTACLIGGFGYLVYHVADIFLHPTGTIDSELSLNVLLLQIIFECMLILILGYPVKKYLGWLVSYFHEEKIWRIVWIFPMVFTIVFGYFIPYDNSKMYIGRALELYIISVSAFVVIVIIIYAMFYRIAYSIVENQKIAERTIYLEMEAEQYRKLQEYVQDTSRLRHDFRHHLTVLSEMIECQEYEEAQKFLRAYHLEVSKTTKQYCASAAINAVLNHYDFFCQEEGISIYFGIRLNYDIIVKDIDFCVLLGNLLENALYGCRTTEKEQRKIELKIGQTAPHVIVLTIRNSYSGIIQKDEDVFLSSRHKGKGQGLKSVSLIAEKYNGFMKVEYNDKQFLVKVLLNV
ncbi:sensor histidine kinase [Haloimpatiens massiliensis]|uniref:sensor histidine kinase n=1 Tax=Haloimpatiens massiliensis TaxID=1658110 RepID=UPI000C82BE63|nr:ATP-binding protein [Haloimpatiens massiliensis]